MIHTPDGLRAFDLRVADLYNAGEIRAPVHLSGGCEEQLIEYFDRNYDRERGDWICTTWRSHYHCLLAGVDRSRLLGDILVGKSITLCYPDHRILSSAIVGGTLPIALGLALAEKLRGGPARMHCFVGDMASRTGTCHEAWEYACGYSLPLNIVVESNGKSVGTPTDEVWGREPFEPGTPKWHSFEYELPWPHSGAGEWVRF